MADSFYSFLPYVRQGLNNLITNEDTYSSGSLGADRISFPLSITLNGNKVGGGTDTQAVSQTLNLKGPGDIIGINSDEIIRVSPANWITNFEPNYLPYIEFYDEDFPWRYTPAKAKIDDTATPHKKYRLRPWVSLVVLTADEFTNAPFNGILPSIYTAASASTIFPNEQQMWAWAHVHVNDNLGDDISATGAGLDKLKSLLQSNPDAVISRIICPRRLSSDTGYYAFLIPTFEAGRKAGIGVDPTGTDGLAPSWTSSTPIGTEYPIYYQWFFKTGAAGDFESLVRLLAPRAVGTNVGKRYVDLQRPGNPTLDTKSPVTTIGLQGVLHPTTETPDNWIPTITDTNGFTSSLATILNAPVVISGDPVIAPPIYGRWHAAISQVSSLPSNVNSNWLNTANLDPRYRIFAGIGAEVIRRNQDKYMDIAWQQVGAVIEANKTIMLMQAAMEASAAMHTKHIVSLSDEMVLNTSASLHAKVKISTETVYKDIADSAVPNSVFSGAFRRMTAPGTTFMRAMDLGGSPVTTVSLIDDLNTGAATIAPAYTAPAGMIPYTIWSSSSLTPAFTSSLPTSSSFAISVPGSALPAFTPGPLSPSAATFVGSVVSLHTTISSLPVYTYTTGPALNISAAANAIRTGTDPRVTVLSYAQSVISSTAAVTNVVTPVTAMDLILAAPKIDLFMYKELAALSTEWIMPGLNGIPDNSMNLLQMDQTYIEAFMLGLNHEMARLLLWRGYPTDQRGTCFSFFWGYENVFNAASLTSTDLDDYKDIYPINQWRTPLSSHPIAGPLSHLGENTHRPGLNISNMLVLTIRGELLRKFPGTIIYMQEAAWQLKDSPSGPTDYNYSKPRTLNTGTTQYPSIGTTLYPIFKASLDPDIYFLGFNIDAATAKGVMNSPTQPGYFFVFQERAGELKFGAEEPVAGTTYTYAIQSPPGASLTWNDLNWGNILPSPYTAGMIDVTTPVALNVDNTSTNPDSVEWAQNSASMAYSLFRQPIKLDVHANTLMP